MNIIEQMFGRDNIGDFLNSYWPQRPYVVDGDLHRLSSLATVKEFHDIELLLKKVEGTVDLLFPGGKRVSVAKAIDALPAYNDGNAMIYIKDVEVIPEVSGACDELAQLLNIPRYYISCEGFAANYGVEVATHFDHETNFMIQIRGDKTWRFSENMDLPNHLYPYFPNNPNRFYQAGSHPYTGEKLPDEMPSAHVERRVGPGTVTFIPRGYWHNTVTHDESFSIGFVINPPTIADLAVSAVLEQLHAIEDLRSSLLSTISDSGRQKTIESLQQALRKLSEISIELSASSLLSKYECSQKGNARRLPPI